MPAPRKYPLELRERAVRMYRTAEPKPVIRRMAEELGARTPTWSSPRWSMPWPAAKSPPVSSFTTPTTAVDTRP
ncbi:hypothetical protein [Streptomyces sp. NPDC057557]|uniref:hypothetical protein n=1 Tax=Streptomyces sp. NPDC057557 TaxID=3346167 RepID=UPI00369C2668